MAFNVSSRIGSPGKGACSGVAKIKLKNKLFFSLEINEIFALLLVRKKKFISILQIENSAKKSKLSLMTHLN